MAELERGTRRRLERRAWSGEPGAGDAGALMASSPLTSVDRPRGPLWVAAAIAAVGIATAAGGYLIGQATGEDLGDVRSAAAAQGRRQGAAAGRKRGYDRGFSAGRREAYDAAHQRAVDAQLRKAGVAP
jgi:hypothetical protein